MLLLDDAEPALGVEARLVDHPQPELHGRVDERDAGEGEQRAGVQPAVARSSWARPHRSWSRWSGVPPPPWAGRSCPTCRGCRPGRRTDAGPGTAHVRRRWPRPSRAAAPRRPRRPWSRPVSRRRRARRVGPCGGLDIAPAPSRRRPPPRWRRSGRARAPPRPWPGGGSSAPPLPRPGGPPSTTRASAGRARDGGGCPPGRRAAARRRASGAPWRWPRRPIRRRSWTRRRPPRRPCGRRIARPCGPGARPSTRIRVPPIWLVGARTLTPVSGSLQHGRYASGGQSRR